MGTVRQKFESSGFEDVRRDHEKLQREVAKLGEANRKLARDAKRAHQTARRGTKETTTSTRDLVRTVGRAVTAYGGFRVAIGLVNASLREQIKLQDKANKTQVRLSSAQDQFVINLGNVSQQVARREILAVQKIAREGGLPKADQALIAGGEVLSGTQGDIPLTKQVLREAIPFVRRNVDQLAPFSSALADLAEIAGAKTQGDVRRQLATVLSIQQQARIPNVKAFPNVATAVASGVEADTSGNVGRAIRETGAIFASAGGSIKDPFGQKTATVTSNFVSKLARLLPEKDFIGLDGKVLRQGTGLQTTGQRLERLFGDVPLQREFLQGSKTFEKFTARGPILPVFEALVQNAQSKPRARFQKALGAISDDPATVNQVLANLNATPQQAAGDFANRSAGNVEAFLQGSSRDARVGAVRNMLRENPKNVQTFLGDVINRSLFEFSLFSGMGPINAGQRAIGMRSQQIRGRAEMSGRDLTAGEQELLQLGRDQLEELRSMARSRANAEFARDPE